MRIRDLSIRSKIIASWASMILVLLAVSGAIVMSDLTAEESLARVQQAQRFDAAVSKMSNDAIRQREALLGFILSGQRERLVAYDDALAEFKKAAEAAHLAAPEGLPDDVIRASEALETWRSTVAAEQLRNMRNPLTTDHARLIEATGEGERAFSQVVDMLNDLRTETAAFMGQSGAAMQSSLSFILTVSAVGALAALGIAVSAALFLISSLSKPLNGLTQDMLQIAGGDFRHNVSNRDRKDEIGGMAGALETFRANLEETERLKHAEEEMRQQRESRSALLNTAIKSFDGDMSSLMKTLGSAVSGLERASVAAAQIAEQTRSNSGAAAEASELTTSNAQLVAAAAEELSASVQEIATQVARSTQIAEDAMTQADATGQTVRTLYEAAQQIGNIVTLISDIAEQTNLLALNATIESARAGEAGKGFAVVASEVKNLATQTGKATDEIAQKVRDIQTMTESAVSAMDRVGTVIRSMNEISMTISSAVEEQGAAAVDIARNIQSAVDGSAEVTRNVRGIADATIVAERSSSEVREASEIVADANGRLKGAFDGFIKVVAAA